MRNNRNIGTKIITGIVLLFIAGLVLYAIAGPYLKRRGYEPAAGDVLVQSSQPSRLINMIKGVSESELSHCGIVVRKDGDWYVLEAVGPVKETELDEWIGHGINGTFRAYRFTQAYAERIPEILKAAYAYLGRPYDKRYRFDDERIYCSELIYKAFKDVTGEELGKVQRLGELNWKPFEASIRYFEQGAVPLERELITPVEMVKAAQLEFVYSNGLGED